MTDPKKRADRWKAKYNLKRVSETLTDLREGMAARYVDRGHHDAHSGSRLRNQRNDPRRRSRI